MYGHLLRLQKTYSSLYVWISICSYFLLKLMSPLVHFIWLFECENTQKTVKCYYIFLYNLIRVQNQQKVQHLDALAHSGPRTGICNSSALWSKTSGPLASWCWRRAVHSTCPQCLSRTGQKFNHLKEPSHQKHSSSHKNRTGSAWVLASQMCAVYEFLYLFYQASCS